MLVKTGEQITTQSLSKPQPGEKIWIDIGPGETIGIPDVAQTLGLEPLIEQELSAPPDRPTLVYIGLDYLVMTVFVCQGQEEQKAVTILLGHDVLVTRHRDALPLIEDLQQDLAQKPTLLESAHYLLYELLERVSDGFLERMDYYEERFDELEEAILDGKDRARDVFALRRTLHQLRGVLADMRRIAARLSRRQFSNGQGTSDANIFVDVYTARR